MDTPVETLVFCTSKVTICPLNSRYYIAGIKQPEIARREGIHSSKVSVAIRRGLRNMRRCYDDLFQTE